ncbi:MAG: sensor histidine kinase [Gemmatimonadota bacterium]
MTDTGGIVTAGPDSAVNSATGECPLAASLASRMRESRSELVRRWLDRISARVTINQNQIFPTDEILDHVPLLIDGIADYLENPADEITADIPVIAKAMELGELRHAQGFDAYEILKEYEILGGVLFDFLINTADEIDEPCTRGELLTCGQRLFRAISVIQQYTTMDFLRRANERVQEREERLIRFNRAVSHEMKNRIGAAGGASAMLEEESIVRDPIQLAKFLSIITLNVAAMNQTLSSLIELSTMESGGEQARNVLLPEAAAEVKRQLREFAESRNVEVELAEDLPPIEVPAAAVELALSNYIVNAVKYRDPAQPASWVRVDGVIATDKNGVRELQVRVSDNGLGVPEPAREKLFEKFFRAHETVSEEEGSGLGLSLVRDTIESVDGRAWAEFPEGGSLFAFAVPLPS